MNKTRVYVGGIPDDVRQSDLEEFFHGYGRIREVLIKRGFAYVEFTDQRDAADAVYQLDGKTLLGREISVQRAREKQGGYPKEDNAQYRVIVENLSTRVQWQDLIEIMSKFGKVDFAKAHNLHLYEGMVQFSNYNGMKKAIEKLDRTELDGRRIRVIAREDHQSRQRSRSPDYRSKQSFRSRSPIHKTRAGQNNSFRRSYQEKDETRFDVRRASRTESYRKFEKKY